MRKVSIDTSNRYALRFGGYHEQHWTEHDSKHVISHIQLHNKRGVAIADVEMNFKPLPKHTLIGYLIAVAIGAA